MLPLTARQSQILDFIRSYRSKHGYSPTTREIAPGIGVKSIHGVWQHLQAIRKKGRLTWDDGKVRSLRIVGEESPAHLAPLEARTVDVFSRIEIHAGRLAPVGPAVWEARMTGPIAGADFGLVVSSSDLLPNYQPGDALFFRRKCPAANGELALVSVGDALLVRRFGVHGDLVQLLAINPAVAPLLVRRADWKPETVLAVAVGMLRRYDPVETSAAAHVDTCATPIM